jgi:hypothetical protein
VVGPGEVRTRPLREVAEPQRVPPANVGSVLARVEPRQRELSNRLQHPEPPLRVAGDAVHQAVLDEGLEAAEHIPEVTAAVGHIHNRVERPPPGEHGEAAE